eukprot:CAMPEP_0197024502 /NCGR_PEP_ID=MMETSP1384-20130603/5035_1 /TAXON_ID=29189 /ORGANISM="Ammonia sp." /LENGTH=435 /DNA_ID=CAMNT_0042452899 /DNA_START=8 /DNA_END=1315 /DNA_ORIENTATION=+
MALQSWMKKEDVFDPDVCRELGKQFGVEDPEQDFSKISSAQWNKFSKEMIFQRKREIKDTKKIKRLEQKLAKIKKKWKTQQGKKFKDTASVTKKSSAAQNDNAAIDQHHTLSAKKAKDSNKRKSVKKKDDHPMNPRHIDYIISHWCRALNIDAESAKYKNIPLHVMVLKYCPVFGYGDDGVLTIKANKEHSLRSDQLYEFESIVLKKKATLTVDVWKTKAPLQEHTNLDGAGGTLLLRVSGNIVMNEGSKITVKACGYPGGFGKGVKGGKGMGVNGSGGEAGEWTSATGGLYKSKGLIDEKMAKLVMGSGGGGITSTANRFFPGGSGGGVLKIECNKVVFKGAGCMLSASGASSIHGAGGSGGVLWLRCLGVAGKDDVVKQCKIACRGGKGDGDEYSKGKENAEDGIVRVDVLEKADLNKIKQIVKCDNVYYGDF